MKKFILLFVIVLLSMLTVAQAASSKYLIANEGVGVFLAGKRIPTKVPGYKITKSEEERYDLYTIYENGEEILNIESFTVPMVDVINLLSNKFKTSKNIGVGSTIEEFVAAYPDYEIWQDGFDYYEREGVPYVITTEQLANVQFFIDANDCINKDKIIIQKDQGQIGNVIFNPSNFKKGAKITRVRIYGEW